MTAVRRRDGAGDESDDALPESDRDWLTLQQAACELNLSTTTVRRMIRSGELQYRAAPRHGGFTYMVRMPGSRHAAALRNVFGPAKAGEGAGEAESDDSYVRDLEAQVERLSQALARALRLKQRSLPAGFRQPARDRADPFARYRWLVRRRKWWPFG